MMSLRLYLAAAAASCLLGSGSAADCTGQQVEREGTCCDLCPPGTYVKEWCSQGRGTVCAPCQEGHYSDERGIWNDCTRCLTCQHEYVRKCTATADAQCSCHQDFLCSNDACSRCEKKIKCKKGEEVKKTGLREHSYTCGPCPNNTYSDTDDGHCKPLTQCSEHGLITLIPGSSTRNAHCGINCGPKCHDFQVILAAGFIVSGITLLMFLSYVCVKNIRKHKEKNCIDPNIEALSPNTCDFHHSKEESGYQLIHQDAPKDSISSISIRGVGSEDFITV